MGGHGSANWGLLAIVAAAVFAALVYAVASMGPPPSVAFALAEGVLLMCVMVMFVDLFAKTAKAR